MSAIGSRYFLSITLIFLTALFVNRPAWAQEELRLYAAEAGEHVGEVALVCGVIASTRYNHDVRGAPTYLNFDKPYPQNPFTVIVWGRDRDKFPYKPESLSQHQACVYGKIESYKGKPQIIAFRPEQIISKPPE